MAIVFHPSNMLHWMVVLHLCFVTYMGHAHVVATTMRQTPCVENFTNLVVETLRLSEYHPINLYV